jgi:hypothetical protein
MSTTPRLGLPLLAAAQAQKHVTHNESLLALDALVQCAVLDKDLGAPPADPAEGDRYIVGPTPTGEWAGKDGQIVLWQDGAWITIAPQVGFIAYVADEALLYVFGGSGWTVLSEALGAIQQLVRFGLGTTADAANPFAAKLNSALWTARGTGEGGSGDLRYTLNKETASNVLSLLLQTGHSGRVELGLVGSDNLVAKVSHDGSTWRQALWIDAATGSLDFLSPEVSVASAATVDLGAQPSRRVAITGTTTITSFGSVTDRERIVRFLGDLTLVHDGTSLNLRNGGANIATAAGDVAFFCSDASGNWSLAAYRPARLGGSPILTGAHATAAPDSAPRGFSSGDTSSVTGSATGFHFLTSLRDTGSHGAQLAIGDGSDGVHVRRLTASSWQAWRRLAEFGSAVAANFGSVTTATVAGTDITSTSVMGSDLAATPMAGSFLQLYGSAHATRPGQLVLGTGGVGRLRLTTTALLPATDAALNLGTAGARLGTIYAATGTINTSDAREKTAIAPLTPAEIAWARSLAAEIGSFQWLDSIVRKGEGMARQHVGLTVQRAVELGAAQGLDPFQYAFICRDDDRHGFRPDQLALFLARGQEERLAALEAALAA